MRTARLGWIGIVLAALVMGAGAGVVDSRGPAHARREVSEETLSLEGLKVTVWSAPAPANAKVSLKAREPVVIFSHGFHGCSTQSRFLMEALAADGYLVFAPNHADATCNEGASKWSDPPEESFGDPQAWTDRTYAGRAADIRKLIAAIPADARFGPRADLSRVALAGHSLGGYTVLGLGGARPGWALPLPPPGVRAVLALSPYTAPFLLQKTLRGLRAPVMYQGGTLDSSITPLVSKDGGAYDQSPAPKYFVEFEGAGHLAWANIGRAASREDIIAYSVAFLDHAVKGAAADPILTQARAGVSLYRYESELGKNAVGAQGSR